MLLKNKKVFITEDNLVNRSVMQLLMEQAGAKVNFERWGRETIPRLKAFAPVDLIILDLMFPDKVTGYDVFQDIRRHTEFDHVPIIAVSASDPDEALNKTREMGFSGFIAKPITDYNLFIKQINAVLNGEQVWYVG